MDIDHKDEEWMIPGRQPQEDRSTSKALVDSLFSLYLYGSLHM